MKALYIFPKSYHTGMRELYLPLSHSLSKNKCVDEIRPQLQKKEGQTMNGPRVSAGLKQNFVYVCKNPLLSSGQEMNFQSDL